MVYEWNPYKNRTGIGNQDYQRLKSDLIEQLIVKNKGLENITMESEAALENGLIEGYLKELGLIE